MGINLDKMAGGVLQEKADQAFVQVMENLQDPDTPWKNKRKINICLTFEQNEERTDCKCDISVSTKLASVKPASTKFCTEKNLSTGEVLAQEYGPGIKGQMSFNDIEENNAEETGEIKETGIIDFRTRKI